MCLRTPGFPHACLRGDQGEGATEPRTERSYRAGKRRAGHLAPTDRSGHFHEEAQALDDKLLAKELSLLQKLKTKKKAEQATA